VEAIPETEALARLDVLVGEWRVEAQFPGLPSMPPGRCVFEWLLAGRFLAQRTEVPLDEAPDSVSIICIDPDSGGYRQHYYDSRGVVRLYEMRLGDGVWELTRDSADFSPLHFRQRFTGTVSADGNTISGAWQKSIDGASWQHDFALTYRWIS
jgi:hypothetical protein